MEYSNRFRLFWPTKNSNVDSRYNSTEFERRNVSFNLTKKKQRFLVCFEIEKQTHNDDIVIYLTNIPPIIRHKCKTVLVQSNRFVIDYFSLSGFPIVTKIRLYTEAQTGFGLGGISSGPVIEINKEEKKTTIGWQSSIWGNYYLGFDFRYRKINGKKFFCLGSYLKTGFNSKDENGNEIKSSSNSYSNWDD